MLSQVCMHMVRVCEYVYMYKCVCMLILLVCILMLISFILSFLAFSFCLKSVLIRVEKDMMHQPNASILSQALGSM